MEIIQHIIGACGDNHAHLDFTDILYAGGASYGIYTVRYYIKVLVILGKQMLININPFKNEK